jgi:hypothetical protein
MYIHSFIFLRIQLTHTDRSQILSLLFPILSFPSVSQCVSNTSSYTPLFQTHILLYKASVSNTLLSLARTHTPYSASISNALLLYISLRKTFYFCIEHTVSYTESFLILLPTTKEKFPKLTRRISCLPDMFGNPSERLIFT